MEYLEPSPHFTKHYWESPAIPLIIGKDDEKRVFYVHETLLIQTSEYFRIALQSQFVEGQEKICRFPEDNQHAVYLLVQYLYSGKYHVSEALSEANGGHQQLWFEMHAHAFALGNKLVAWKFKQYVVFLTATVLETYQNEPTMKTLLKMSEIVYDGTTENDGKEMRKLLATYCASRIGTGKCSLGPESKGWWSVADSKLLAESQQEEFMADVLRLVPFSQKLELASFMARHYTKS